MAPSTPRQVINGWKAIAAYTGKAVRTVQDWEKDCGLPIYREPSGVWAYAYDLDKFVQSRIVVPTVGDDRSVSGSGNQDNVKPLAPLDAPPQAQSTMETEKQTAPIKEQARPLLMSKTAPTVTQSWLVKRKYGAIGLLAASLLILWAGVKNGNSRPQPSRIRVDADTLVTLDQRGREMWAYTFTDGLGFYTPRDERHLLNEYAIGDLSGTGAKDVIFIQHLGREGNQQGSRLCLLREGKLIKSLTLGRSIVMGPDPVGDRYTQPYIARNVLLIPHEPHPLIAVASLHHVDAPAQVLIVDHDFNIVGEYWHPGHLSFMALADVDHNGRPLLILGGVNNLHHSATLVGFDPTKVSGTTRPVLAPQLPNTKAFALLKVGDSDAALQELPLGSEKFVVLFPRSDIMFRASRSLEPYNRVQGVNISADGIMVSVAESTNQDSPVFINYFLNFKLTVTEVAPSTEFRSTHDARFEKGWIDHRYSMSDANKLKANVVVMK